MGQNGPVSPVSDSGRFLAFRASTPIAGVDNRNDACNAEFGAPGLCQQVYRYDSDTGDLDCVSCPADGRPTAHARIGGGGFQSQFPRAVLDDGTVFFETSDALSTRDTNGKVDVYGYASGLRI